jgi:hypothetical protein
MVGSTNLARCIITASVRTNENVLVTSRDNARILNSAELYDPSTRIKIWTTAVRMHNASNDHTATISKDGKISVTGGQDDTSLIGAKLDRKF